MSTRHDDELLALILDPLEEIPVIGLDAKGKVVRWTPGAARATGYGADEILSKHVGELYVEEDVARGRPCEDLRVAEEQGYSVSDGWRSRRDGSRFWARTILRSRRDDDGRLTGFVKVTVDLTDQIEVRSSLLASDQRFAGLVELSVDGIISTDADGRVSLFNRGAESMFGYDRHEVVGEPLSMLLPERYHEAHAEYLQAFVAGDSTGGHMAGGRVVTARSKDGMEFPVAASISKLSLDDGLILSVILRDASEQDAVEHALVDRLARERSLAGALSAPIALVDREFNYVFGNAAQAEWLGCSETDLRGRPMRSALKRMDLEAVLRGEPRRYSGRFRHADGTVREVEAQLTPARNESGIVDGFYMVTVDLTEGPRVEADRGVLTAMGQLLRAHVDPDLMLQGATLMSVAGFADECTGFLGEGGDRLLRHVGRSEGGMGGRDSIPRSDAPGLVAQVLADLHPRASMSIEDRVTRVAVPIPCVERGPGAMLFEWRPPFDIGTTQVDVARDLGRHLAVAIDQVALSQRARGALKAREWLLRKVTHDLGNPVASIVMVVDRILRAAPTPDRRAKGWASLEGVAQQADQMKLIIEELLDSSALRTGLRRITPRPVEATAVIQEVCSLLEAIAVARGVALTADVPAARVHVVADAHHLGRALTALASEVLARCPAGGRVSVGLSRVGGDVRFEVVGPGPSISGSELLELLERGPATGGGDTSAHEVGLSLLIAAELAHAMGGDLDVSKTPGGDTRYAFSLPALD